MHWQRLIDRNTSELLKYNQTAVKYINGEVPQIFASGYNKVAEQIPDSPVAGFDFELINADTVNNLVHEDGIILPPKKKVDPEKDKAWNAKLINAQLLQGIMQGESIPDMAKRMMTVANSDLAGATRTARTMHTAAQNAGRQSGYNKAAQQGIIFEKTWISARQINRTRDTHYALHGTTIPYDKKFVTDAENELEFPGDWRAPGEEVYNCRCTLITRFKGFKKLNGEEPEHTRHEEPEKQQKTAAEKIAETVETIVKATTRAEAEAIMFGDNGIFNANPSITKKKISDEMMISVANTFQELENKFAILSKFTKKFKGVKPNFRPMRSKHAIAACYLSDGSMEFNPKFFSDTEVHRKTVLETRNDGFFMDFKDENALMYAFTHEYGHAVEGYYAYIVVKADNKEKLYKEIKNEISEIAKKNHPEINVKDLISGYGMTNAKEFFAETFANSQCGAPNELGEAMNEWLKEKGLLK